ncbi:MAG: WhiB family transcriptional regulator [Actinomycetota bacterium]|nr:WhiB family transcriptional regulator [Actinomycetota bacterium]
MCAGCLVQDECLTFALESDEEFGVWDGRTPNERQRLRNRLVA